MFRHIVVALDSSKRAERALPIAGRLAHTTGSRLLLLRVVHVPMFPGPAIEPPPPILVRIGAELERIWQLAERPSSPVCPAQLAERVAADHCLQQPLNAAPDMPLLIPQHIKPVVRQIHIGKPFCCLFPRLEA